MDLPLTMTHECILVDDEIHALEGLKRYIGSIPNLVIKKTYINPLDALVEISSSDEIVDLILLDIDMPQISGIELSKSIRQKTKKLVFTTSYSKYGYDAYEANADAYLLKPYSLAKFASTISKLFPYEDSGKKDSLEINGYFFVKNKEDNLKIVKLRYDDVIAIESKLNYVMVYTSLKKVLTYISLTEMFDVLRVRRNFVQFHRSYIINKDHIEYIEGNMIKMDNGLRITVGDYYRKEFSAFITAKLVKGSQKIHRPN